MNITRSLAIAAMGTVLTLFGAAGASADPWHYNHPRRTEVNDRLANQNYRIDRDYRDGDIAWARRATFMPKIATFAARNASMQGSMAATSRAPNSGR